jgi:uncharacterized protein YbjT (DUF2867 family)
MRVLVTGAYGLIGSACLARLRRDGHDLTATGRSIAGAARRLPFARWRPADFDRLEDPASWRPLLAGIEAVVNCVGVLQDGGRDDVARVLRGTCALFDACAALGVRRLVHVSALGADVEGATAFARARAQAEAHLQILDLDWVILRPALVMSPAVYGGSAMLRALAACPAVTPVIGGEARVQIVGIDDLAETVARALRPDAPARVAWTLAHPQIWRLADIVVALRQWMGFAPRRVVELPRPLAAVVAALADCLGRLGWRNPARSTARAQLAAGVVGDPAAWMTATGIVPASLTEILAARPASVQDRWFAKLYLLKPIAVGALAAALIALGGVLLATWRPGSIVPPGPPAFFQWIPLAHGVFDIAAGLALLVRATARAALFAALLAWCAVDPVLWLVGVQADWFGAACAFMQVAPLVLAAVFLLAILDDR